MNNPAKQYSVSFVSDETSTDVSFDCSVAPISEDFRGKMPAGVLLPAISSVASGPVSNVVAVLEGTTVTLSFANPLPRADGNGNLIVYTASFYLQY